MRDLLNQHPKLKYLFIIGIFLLLLLIGVSSCRKVVILPNVLGLSYEEALSVLEDFKVEPLFIYEASVPSDTVIAMNLPADREYKTRTKLELTVAHNSELPDLMGMDLDVALGLLEGYEITIVKIYTGARLNDSVIGMSLKPGTRYEVGSEITLQVEENIGLTDVVGYEAEFAVQLLEEAGFNVELNEVFEMFPGSQKNHVLSIDLSAEAKYPLNTSVTMTVLRQKSVKEVVIEFKDQNLEMAVMELFDGKEAITNFDVENITRIQVDELVTSLEGLEHFINLETLIVKNSSIGSLLPLSSLEKITELHILGGGINDLTPLSNMQLLNYINLKGNPIKDISPIEGLDIEQIIIE